MNVDQIYQFHRDDAFADQFEDDQYRTFLAMPFSSRGGYPEKRIHALLKEAHAAANAKILGLGLPRTFAELRRVDDGHPGALVITDEIIRRILRSHFFVGDLTGGNEGVLIEIGLALALKPNARVMLFSQDGTSGLHFDLKVTNINSYKEETLVGLVADAIVGAAKAYEDEANRYVNQVSAQLTPDALIALNRFGQLYRGDTNGVNPSLWEGRAEQLDDRFKGPIGRAAFLAAVRELLSRRLMWTHYEAGIDQGADGYGIHATKLGWRVIEQIWGKHDPKMKMPSHAITGPNQKPQGPRFATLAPRSIKHD